MDGEGEEGGSSREGLAGVLACACAGRGHVRRLVPHTILCPQVFRNFLEIVKHHRRPGVASVCVMCDVMCAGHVWVGCMPSGQSEEYHIVTVQSDQARVGFSSSGSIFGSGVAVACRWVGGRVGGAAGGGPREWRRCTRAHA